MSAIQIDLGESKSLSVKAVEKTPEMTTKPSKSAGELVAEFEEWYTNTVEFSSDQQRELDALVERKELFNVVQRVRNQDLTAIAVLETELYLAVQVLLGRVMEDIDSIRSIEAELEAEDENLVSIDGRYVQAIEEEHLRMRAEEIA